jgi:hypothetical protein
LNFEISWVLNITANIQDNFFQDPGISLYMSDPNADGFGLKNGSMFDPNEDESSKILANVRSLARTKPICVAMSDPECGRKYGRGD